MGLIGAYVVLMLTLMLNPEQISLLVVATGISRIGITASSRLDQRLGKLDPEHVTHKVYVQKKVGIFPKKQSKRSSAGYSFSCKRLADYFASSSDKSYVSCKNFLVAPSVQTRIVDDFETVSIGERDMDEYLIIVRCSSALSIKRLITKIPRLTCCFIFLAYFLLDTL